MCKYQISNTKQPNAPNGCSGGMDWLAIKLKKRTLRFSFCCDEHDLFYEQGGSVKDRAFADKVLQRCIYENLKKRQRPLHPAWLFWLAVRLFGWLYWSRNKKI